MSREKEQIIAGLHHIAILCSERERSLKFYQALGFVLRENHIRPERNDEIIFMEHQGVTLELFITKDCPPRVTGPEAYGLRHLALRTVDIEKNICSLERAGYAVEPLRRDSFTGEKMTFVKDPDGLPIELHE